MIFDFFKRLIEKKSVLDELKESTPLDELEYYALELNEWKFSKERGEMMDGDAYYHGYQKMLGPKFMRVLKDVGCEALNESIAWLYPYFDDTGDLRFRVFPGYEVKPFWKDTGHTELEKALRLYPVETYINRVKRVIEKVDVFDKDGVRTFIFDNGRLYPDPDMPHADYISMADSKGEVRGYNWDRLPLIPVKYNSKEIPLIRRAKQLQDAINTLMSDFANNMQENTRNTILVLKNYDGTDLGEFRRNLVTYGAVKVRSAEGADGGVSTLNIEVNASNYEIVLKLLKDALVENMRSYDAKDERMSTSPNQMNIQSMYSDIDLDANEMETELQASFEEILWFVNTYLANTGKGEFFDTPVRVIFNRDMPINESEAIENCAKSVGIISNETIVAQHPWVDDVSKELERLEAEKAEMEESDPYRAAFENTELEDEELTDE